ncbi:MAG TPA: transketolase C-terminal domain-containing protein [Rugosimonospora sp.]|nr:transketolase C-terminal domain-containing protein [Rugosimonospora sp.]
MPKLSYAKALNRALGEEMARDPAVFVLGEDIRLGLNNVTTGLLDRFGPRRVLETPLSEQGFTDFATGAAMAGLRPVVEYQIPFLTLLVLEQIANQANKFSVMSGGQTRVPVTYLLPGTGWRPGWGAQHSDQTYAVFAHTGVKTVVPATPSDAYGLFLSAIRDDDPVLVCAPMGALGLREDVDYADLAPVPLGVGAIRRGGTDVTVVAVGHLVPEALAVAEQLAGEVSVEVLDPRTVYPFDWALLAASLEKTGRLVVCDDTNRFCGLAGEILATAAEEYRLVAPPRRVTRPDGAVVIGCDPELDLAVQPNGQQLTAAIQAVVKTGR